MHQPPKLVTPELLVEPFESVGPIKFGMSKTDVEQALGRADRQIDSYLWYAELGLKIELCSDRCVFVESALRRVVLIVRGIRLEGSLERLVEQFVSVGATPSFGSGANRGAVDIFDWGISLWREDDEPAEIDTAAAWERGYWERPC